MPLPFAPMTLHRPARPGWACECCRLAWPCLNGRRDLAAEFAGRPAFLLYYMSAQLVEYMSDSPEQDGTLAAAMLYPRFIAWVWPATAPARAA